MPVISKITGAPFRFWCQKILPAVYDDSLSYYELLCKVVDYLNKVMEDDINVVNLVNELEEFVNNYFDNLDVQEEINNKLDAMAEDGSLIAIIAPHLDPIIADYEAALDADLAEYKETMDADVADFKSTVNNAIDAQDTDITNFKNTVNGQVSAQNTEIADFKSSVNTTVTEQDNDISVMKSQMSNFIDSYSNIKTFTELYTATPTNGLHYINQIIDLSDPYTDYEELDIYWRYNSDEKVIRVKSADLLADGAYISWYVDKSPDTGIPAPLYITMMKLVNGNAAHTQLMLGVAYSEEWNGLAASDATRDEATTASEYTAGEVYKIVGVTYTTSAELTDIRVGANGKVYSTAGNAVRGQYSDLKNALENRIEEVNDSIGVVPHDVEINPTRGHRYYVVDGELRDISDIGNTFYADIIDVVGGDTYYYSGRVYNYTNQYSVIVTDDDNNVLLTALDNAEDTSVTDYMFSIPIGGTKLYITSYKREDNPGASDLALKKGTLYNIDDIKNAIGGTIPDYYLSNDWLQEHVDEVNENSGFVNGVVFPFITDIHFHSNANNSKYLLKELLKETACSYVIAGGDYQGGFGGAEELKEQFDAWFDFCGYVGHDILFPVAGNHDFYEATSADASRDTWVKATYGEVYNALFRPSQRWQMNRKAGGYYCLDIDSAKTRFVMMNSHEPSPVNSNTLIDGLIRVRPEQIEWLISVLKEKTDYKIIVVSHVTSDSAMPDYADTMANVQTVLEAFANKTSATIQFTEQYSVTANFTDTTNTLMCHLNGHSHVDASHVSNGVLSICTTCDACLQDDGYGAVQGTVTEQAFDVFCVDYDAMTIKAVGIGRGNSRAWEYVNGSWQAVN